MQNVLSPNSRHFTLLLFVSTVCWASGGLKGLFSQNWYLVQWIETLHLSLLMTADQRVQLKTTPLISCYVQMWSAWINVNKERRCVKTEPVGFWRAVEPWPQGTHQPLLTMFFWLPWRQLCKTTVIGWRVRFVNPKKLLQSNHFVTWCDSNHLQLTSNSLTSVAERRALSRLLSFMDNPLHPLHSTISRQRSNFSNRPQSLSCSTDTLRKSFLPHALRLFSSTRGALRGMWM